MPITETILTNTDSLGTKTFVITVIIKRVIMNGIKLYAVVETIFLKFPPPSINAQSAQFEITKTIKSPIVVKKVVNKLNCEFLLMLNANPVN